MLRRKSDGTSLGEAEGPELEQFYDQLMKTTNSLDSLRRLHVLLHSNSERQLPEEVSIALLSTLCDDSVTSSVREFCSVLLQESLPNETVRVQDFEGDVQFGLDTLQQLITHQEQDSKTRNVYEKKLATALNEYITSERSSPRLIRKAIPALVQFLSFNPSFQFAEKDRNDLRNRLQSFLKSSLSVRTTKQQTATGMTSQFNTILCLPESVTDDFRLNVQTFSSLLQLWKILFDDKESGEFLIGITDYCLRIVDQSELSSLKNQDLLLMRASLVESIKILDRVCHLDVSHVIRIFAVIRRIHDQSTDLVVTAQTLQFMLHHGHHIAYDPITELNQFFSESVCSEVENLPSSYEVVVFIETNLERFNRMVPSPLRTFFPNIFKLLAWSPITFASEFIGFLPTFLNIGTSVEVLHYILDLPCVTSALILTLQESTVPNSLIQSLSSPNSKAMIKFVLRKDSGSGETLDRLQNLHQPLQAFASHPRVLAASRIVLPLLREFFRVIKTVNEVSLTLKLIPVILERSKKLLDIEQLVPQVHKVFAEELLSLIQSHPLVVLEHRIEITEFLSTVGNTMQDFSNNLVWCVGQFTSSFHCPDLLPDVIRGYYDMLECVLYEHLGSYSPKTVSMTVSTMVKLSSRCQDLVPRILLCLGKVLHFAQSTSSVEWTTVSLRVEEFMSVLREQNVASVVLSPSPDILYGRQHLDNMSLPSLWRATTQMVSPSPKRTEEPPRKPTHF